LAARRSNDREIDKTASRARSFDFDGVAISPLAKSKIQFNGVGGLPTYISFTNPVAPVLGRNHE
jgi:hypothetical protein